MNTVKTILIADDSRSIRGMLASALRAAGYDVVEAEDGSMGLTCAQGKKLNLIITDLNMPNVDGLEFLRRVRSLPEHQKTPILLFTTESQQHLKEQAKAAGATGWIVKPMAPERLLQVVSQVVA